MSLQVTLNPYMRSLGAQHTAGLTAVEAVLIASITFDQLNDDVYGYVQPAYYTSPDLFTVNELKSILPFAMNSYLDPSLKGYNGTQMGIIGKLLNSIVSGDVQYDSIPDFLLEIEDGISKSGLTFEEQAPLYMATAVGKADYDYWGSAGGNWVSKGYLNTSGYALQNNIPHYMQAAMYGALCMGNQAETFGLIDPPKIIGVNMVTALYASIGLAAGKVIFKWIPRVGEAGCNCGH